MVDSVGRASVDGGGHSHSSLPHLPQMMILTMVPPGNATLWFSLYVDLYVFATFEHGNRCYKESPWWFVISYFFSLVWFLLGHLLVFRKLRKSWLGVLSVKVAAIIHVPDTAREGRTGKDKP